MKPLNLKEIALKEEMKERCLAKGQYIDENAKAKFEMLCHLEDFEVQYWELQQENKQLKEQVDRYKRLIEYLKKLDFYEFDLDYDYEENPIDNYYPADMEYHINNWLANEELESDE